MKTLTTMVILTLCVAMVPCLPADASEAAMDAAHRATAKRMIDNALGYLAANRDPKGGWSINGAFRPAVTALVLKGFLQHRDYTIETPIVREGFDAMLKYQQPNGGIYNPKEGRSNYSTAIAVTALAAANDPKFKPRLDKAVRYLRSLQIVPGNKSPDGREIDKGHPYLGGVSYGRHGRPDLNNLGWWMQAMRAAGVGGDDPAMRNALAFVTRTQNRSESNTLAWAKDGTNDGGFIYAPAGRDVGVGESKAGTDAGRRGLRSYGSITYVGFMSMLHAGLKKDDPRVRAAYGWIRRYWRLDRNPNMPQTRSQDGLYFYYLVFARALRAWGLDRIPDIHGDKKHNWREELIDAIAPRTGKDGSFINAGASRWAEGNAVLVTAYVVQALQETLKK